MDYVFYAGAAIALAIFFGLLRIAQAIERRTVNVNLPMPIALKHIMTDMNDEEGGHHV